MRVIHIFSGLFQGGAEAQLERLICASGDVEHIVISLIDAETDVSKRLQKKGVLVIFSGVGFNPFSFLRFRKILKAYIDDNTVIQCWMYHANLIGWFSLIGVKVPIFWNIRRTSIPVGLTGFISRLSSIVSHFSQVKIFCNSRSGIASHIKSGYKSNKFIYVPNGFATDLAPFSKKLLTSVVDSSCVNVCSVGRFHYDKGQDVLLSAINLLKDNLDPGLYGKVHFYFVGRGFSDSLEVKSMIDGLDIFEKVTFLGERQDVPEILQCMDIFCLPSRTEGFPNVLVEAMLSSLPCVATNVGDVKSILPVSNLIVEPESPSELALKLSVLIKTDESEKKHIGLVNRVNAQSRFDIKVSSGLYIGYYQKVLGLKFRGGEQ